MSLYYEAAEVLTSVKENNGSLKSVVFGKKTWKSDAKTLFALAAEAAKWSSVLSEVVEKSGIMKLEKNVGTFIQPRPWQKT
jgi:putative methyltransferase